MRLSLVTARTVRHHLSMASRATRPTTAAAQATACTAASPAQSLLRLRHQPCQTAPGTAAQPTFSRIRSRLLVQRAPRAVSTASRSQMDGASSAAAADSAAVVGTSAAGAEAGGSAQAEGLEADEAQKEYVIVNFYHLVDIERPHEVRMWRRSGICNTHTTLLLLQGGPWSPCCAAAWPLPFAMGRLTRYHCSMAAVTSLDA